MDSYQNEQESSLHKNSQRQQALNAPNSFLPSILHQLGLDGEHADASDSINEQLVALHDNDWRVRVNAIRTLETWGEKVPPGVFVQALDDEDSAVRAAAVHALGMLGEQAPLERLLLALQDGDWHVRETAVLVLGNLGARVPERSLILAMKDSDSMVREAAQLVLHQRHNVVVSAVEPGETKNTYAAQMTYSIVMEDAEPLEAHADKYVQFSRVDTLQQWQQRKTGFWRSHLIILVVCVVLLVGIVNVAVWVGFTYKMHVSPSPISVGNEKAMPTKMPYLSKETPTPLPPSISSVNGTPVAAIPAGQTIYTYHNSQSTYVSGVAWSPDGTRIASVSADGILEVWDAFSGQRVFKWIDPYQNSILTVAWSPDGTYIAVGGTDSQQAVVPILIANTGRLASIDHIGLNAPQASQAHIGALRATSAGGPGTVYSLAWSPDSLKLAAGVGDGTVQVFDTKMNADVLTIDTSGEAPSDGNASASSVAWSPDGNYIAYGLGSQLRLWNLVTGQLQVHTPNLSNDWVTSVAWSSDSRYLAIGLAQKNVGNVAAEIWNPSTGQDTIYRNRFVRQWSPDGTYIAGADTGLDVQVWDSTNSNVLLTYPEKAVRVSCVAWSPDGNFIASCDDAGNINVWRAP